MLLLLEGPDGGGKTTLAKSVFSHLRYVHNGPLTTTDPTEMFWEQLRNLVPNDGTSVVVDRSWPSEMIYGRLANRPVVFDRAADRMFQRVLLGEGGTTIICLPDEQRCREVWRARADRGLELLTKDEDFAQMYQFYRGWLDANRDVAAHWDYGSMSTGDLLCQVGYRRYPRCPPGVLGSQMAKVLVVGEQANVKRQPAWAAGMPFVSPGGSSKTITQWLDEMGLGEHQLCWTNALGPSGIQSNPAVIQELPCVVAILALGLTAASWAEQARRFARTRKITLCPATHPAAWTRFRAGQPWDGLAFEKILRFAAEHGWC